MPKKDFKRCYFIDNDLTNADFSYSFYNNISVVAQRFDYMNMKSVDLYRIDLTNCSFEKTDLRFSDLRDGIFNNVSFRGADMRASYLDGDLFFSCNFEGVHIDLKDFEEATLEETTLENAIIYDDKNDPNEDIMLS